MYSRFFVGSSPKRVGYADRDEACNLPKAKRVKLTEVADPDALEYGFVEDSLTVKQLLKESPHIKLKFANGRVVPKLLDDKPVMIKRLTSISSSESQASRTLSYYWMIKPDGTEEQVFSRVFLGMGFYYVDSRQRVPDTAKFKHVFVNKYQKHYATDQDGAFVPVGTSCQLKIRGPAKPRAREQAEMRQRTVTMPSAPQAVSLPSVGLFQPVGVSAQTPPVSENGHKAKIDFILNK